MPLTRAPRTRVPTRRVLPCAFVLLLSAGTPSPAFPGLPPDGGPEVLWGVGPVEQRAAAPAGRTLHVSRRGDDGSRGSRRAPLRTIAEALDRAQDGSTVVIHAGVYRESIEVEGVTDVTLRAAPRAAVWLDGSRPVRQWSQASGTWVATGWTAEFDSSPTYTWGEEDNDAPGWQFVDPAHPMAAHPDQVWIDDVPQEQVGSLAEVGPGRFFVDEEGDRLHLGSDPTGRDVRASVLAKGLSVRAAGTRVRGIGVRRFANSVPHMGAVTVEAPDVRLVDVAIEENATGGLHVMQPRVRLERVRLVDNGMMGLSATGADHLRIDGLQAIGNNRERFRTSPAAGGAKIGRSRDVGVRNSVLRDNLGTGLWFDESVLGISVLGSRLTDNAVHGLSLELSGAVLVAGNVIADNGGNGIKVNDTSDVAIWNNTLAGNHREVNIVQDDRDLDSQGSYLDPSLPLTFRNGPVVLSNNVLSRTAADSDCLLCVEDYSDRMTASDMGIWASGNLYHRSSPSRPRHLVLWSRGEGATAFSTLRTFRLATGQERSGQEVDSPALRSDYRLTKACRTPRSHDGDAGPGRDRRPAGPSRRRAPAGRSVTSSRSARAVTST